MALAVIKAVPKIQPINVSSETSRCNQGLDAKWTYNHFIAFNIIKNKSVRGLHHQVFPLIAQYMVSSDSQVSRILPQCSSHKKRRLMQVKATPNRTEVSCLNTFLVTKYNKQQLRKTNSTDLTRSSFLALEVRGDAKLQYRKIIPFKGLCPEKLHGIYQSQGLILQRKKSMLRYTTHDPAPIEQGNPCFNPLYEKQELQTTSFELCWMGLNSCVTSTLVLLTHSHVTSTLNTPDYKESFLIFKNSPQKTPLSSLYDPTPSRTGLNRENPAGKPRPWTKYRRKCQNGKGTTSHHTSRFFSFPGRLKQYNSVTSGQATFSSGNAAQSVLACRTSGSGGSPKTFRDKFVDVPNTNDVKLPVHI
ncbi:hypothetical protein B0H11DRAFT_1924340 [Mycena galericulata]|nr:hypothetical protein B0H11DRAFT_1924340 [Mycena galericulata]